MKKSLITLLLKRFHLLICVFTFVWFLLSPALLPEKTSACACCANEGEWYERKQRLESHEVEVLKSLKFSAQASLYEMSELPGIPESFLDSALTLSLTRQPSRWIFLLKGGKGEKGTLICNLPTIATTFGADLHDEQKPSGVGPVLYKELRLEGKVSGTGVFAKAMKPETRFRLVLQGRGNNCLMAEDFRNWNLRIYDRQADLTFYGAMQKSPPQK